MSRPVLFKTEIRPAASSRAMTRCADRRPVQGDRAAAPVKCGRAAVYPLNLLSARGLSHHDSNHATLPRLELLLPSIDFADLPF